MNFYQAIAIGSAVLAVLAGAWDAYRLRREQRYSATVMVITSGGPVLSLWLYVAATNLALKPIVMVGLVGIGAVAGVYVARRAKLSEVDAEGQIRLVGASWLPLPAAASVGAIQLAGAANWLAGEVLALAALEATVAFGVAAAVTLIYRRSTLGTPSKIALTGTGSGAGQPPVITGPPSA